MKSFPLFKMLFLSCTLSLFAEKEPSSWYQFDPVTRTERWQLSLEKEVEQTFDLAGNRLSWKDWEGEILYSYDPYNHLASTTAPSGGTTFYKHNLLGRLEKITYPSGQEVSYSHQPGGKLKTVSFLEETVLYSYDPDTNLLTKKETTSGLSTEYAYDGARRVSDIIHKDHKGDLIAHFYFEYDAMNNRIFSRVTTPTEETTTKYTYDKLYRLIEVVCSNGSFEKYTYDVAGNRLTKEASEAFVRYGYNEKGELIQANDTFYEYSPSGKLMRKASSKEEAFYLYDELGHLISYKDEKNTVTFTYNGQGERITKTINGKTTKYLYEDTLPVFQVLEERAEEKTRQYVYGNNCIGFMEEGKAFYYLEDGPGSSVGFIVDEKGNVIERISYDSFGKNLSSSASAVQYNGEHVDPETGLIFLRTRYYDPEVGRFISPDQMPGSLKTPQSLNRYAYVNNNPINFQDPMGTTSQPKGLAISPSYWANGVPIWEEGDPLPEAGTAMLVVCARNQGARINSPDESKSLRGIEEVAGHAWIEIVDNEGKHTSYSTHDALDSEGTYLNLADVEGKRHDQDTIRIGYIVSDDTANRAISQIKEFTQNPYKLFSHNCVGATHTGASAAGIESLFLKHIPSHMETENGGMDASIITPGSLHSRMKKMIKKELKAETAEQRKQELLWLHQASDEPYFPRTFAPKNVFQAESEYVPVPPLSSKGKRGTFGGICLSKRADLKIDLEEIYGVVFDEEIQQLILVGKKRVHLPEMPLDDLAVAVHSLYGLRGPAESPSISIEPSGDKMGVFYKGATFGTEFGRVLFEGDLALKMLFLGKYRCSVPGFAPLIEKERGREKHTIQDWKEMTLNTYRTWIEPEEISLVQTEDGHSMVFEIVKMKCLYETTYNGKSVSFPLHKKFAQHFTENYDAIAKEYPIFNEVKRLGQITGVVQWIKDNNIPIDLSFFDAYIPKHVETPTSLPIHKEKRYSKDAGKRKVKGGVVFFLNDTNFSVKNSSQIDPRMGKVTSSRPSDTSFMWDAEGLTAQAFPLAKTRKVGACEKAYTDVEYPAPGDFPLAFIRRYNSFHDEDEGLGMGWSFVPFRIRLTKKIECFNGDASFMASPKLIVQENGEEWIYAIYARDAEGRDLYLREDEKQQIQKNHDHTYTLCLPKGKGVHFTESGAIASITDENQVITTYNYLGNKLSSISHQNGKSIQLTYHGDKLAEVKGPDGSSVFYRHNAQGQLEEVSIGGTSSMSYEYDKDLRLTRSRSGAGETIFEGEYDDYSRLTRIKVGESSIRKEYNFKEGTSSTLEVKGAPFSELFNMDHDGIKEEWKEEGSEYTYNKAELLSKVVDSSGDTWKFFYDEQDNLILKENPSGLKEGFVHDQHGRLVNKIKHFPIEEREYSGRAVYVGPGNLHLMGYHKEHKTDFEYNNIGRVGKMRTGDEETTFSYDENGSLVEVCDPSGYAVRRELDGLFRTRKLLDRKGSLISFVFDGEGRVIEETTASGTMHYSYSPEGYLTRATDRLGVSTEFSYDDKGSLVKVVDGEGSTFSLYSGL